MKLLIILLNIITLTHSHTQARTQSFTTSRIILDFIHFHAANAFYGCCCSYSDFIVV